MKKSILLFLVLLSSSWTFSAPIDSVTALRVANCFFLKHHTEESRFDQNQSRTRHFSIATSCFNNFYVLNATAGGGFVIVAKDDRALPVLAYSETGTMAMDSLPPAVREWLNLYESEIEWCKQNVSDTDRPMNSVWEDAISETCSEPRDVAFVTPLLTTNWGQSGAYATYTPTTLLGGHCPTGCVATAMAQVMKYWEYPTRGNGSHSYYCSVYGTQSANFSNAIYSWFNMPDQLSTNSSNTAIAYLMYHCGVSVDMDYGINGSAAYVNDCPNALINNFRYATSATFLEKSNYTLAQWKAMLKENLDSDMPLIYYGNGHCFVCDGYNSNDYFHFNWGWDANYNGYFSLTSLTPGSSDFTSDQAAVFGIRPSESHGGSNLVLNSAVSPSSNSLCPGETFSVNVCVANYGSHSFNGYLTVVAENAEDSEDNIIIRSYPVNISGGYHTTYTIPSLSVSRPGNYILRMYYTTDDDTYYWIYGTNSYSNAASVAVRAACPDEYEDNNVANSSALLGTVTSSSKTFIVNATIHDEGDIDYYKIKLPSGYKYTVTGVLTSSYNSSNYTANVWIAYTNSYNSMVWSSYAHSQTPQIVMNNGGILYLCVAPYTTGTIGTYLLAINVVRTSITDINETDTLAQDFVIYPNPTSGKCMVTFPDNGVSGELRLFNVNGEIVMRQQIVSQSMTIDVSHLASGIYSVAYLRDDKMVAIRKVIRK